MSSPRTILVVDDDDELRQTVGDLLEEEGYAVVSASNGVEALERLRTGPRPGLILLDLMMPVMNGWQFRREQLRDAGLAEIPVIVVTASRSLQRTPVDAAAILLKPLALDDLLRAIEHHFLPSAPPQ